MEFLWGFNQYTSPSDLLPEWIINDAGVAKSEIDPLMVFLFQIFYLASLSLFIGGEREDDLGIMELIFKTELILTSCMVA